MKSDIVFDGDDLLVRINIHDPLSTQLVISFHPRWPMEYTPGSGFAEKPLNKLEINNLHFINKKNHWWQTAEMALAIETTLRTIDFDRLDHIVAYGSSMGAYGALLHSDSLHCTHVVALGPQYSIDREKVQFEKRWHKEASELNFQWDDMNLALQSKAKKIVIYDNKSDDRHHIALMYGHNLQKTPIPYAGHAVGKFLKETGLLKPLFTSMIESSLEENLPAIIHQSRSLRKNSGVYMNALLDDMVAHSHTRTALILAKRFVAQKPKNFKLRNRLTKLLATSGAMDEARNSAKVGAENNKVNLGSLKLLKRLSDSPAPISILHIGKTGGTALKTALGQANKSKHLAFHGHADSLNSIGKKLPHHDVIFGVRDPITRYVSAFNSRLRKGLPRYHTPWSKSEQIAFSLFDTPNALAIALSSSNPFEKSSAELSMLGIRHVNQPLSYYLGGINNLKKNEEKIKFIYLTELLTSDFEIMKTMLGIPKDVQLPSDDIAAHKSPDEMPQELTDQAIENLELYYKSDIKIYRHCVKLHDQILKPFGSKK